MNASEFFEQLERDRERLLARPRPYRMPATIVELPAERMELDRLSRTERASYDTGAWLGASVRSVELNNDAFTDHWVLAELSARIRVQLERQEVVAN